MLTKFQGSSANNRRSGQAIAEPSSDEAISCWEAFGNLDRLGHLDRSLPQSLQTGAGGARSQTADCILDNPSGSGQ